jgi:hypothetical protein
VSGPAVVALSLPDPPEVWQALGFDVARDGRCQIGATTLRLDAAQLAWTLAGAEGADDLDGIATQWADGPNAASGAHANTAIAVDHVVVLSPDPDRTRAAFEAAGMLTRRERDAGEGRRQLFFRHGEAIVELVGPVGEATRLWGLTVTVADIDAAAARLGERLGPPKDAVQPGRRIAVARAPELSLSLALMTPALG